MTKFSSLLDWFFHFCCSGQVLGPYGGEGQRWSRHFVAEPREIYSELSGKRLPCYLGWISGKADYSRLTAISFHWKYVRQTTIYQSQFLISNMRHSQTINRKLNHFLAILVCSNSFQITIFPFQVSQTRESCWRACSNNMDIPLGPMGASKKFCY